MGGTPRPDRPKPEERPPGSIAGTPGTPGRNDRQRNAATSSGRITRPQDKNPKQRKAGKADRPRAASEDRTTRAHFGEIDDDRRKAGPAAETISLNISPDPIPTRSTNGRTDRPTQDPTPPTVASSERRKPKAGTPDRRTAAQQQTTTDPHDDRPHAQTNAEHPQPPKSADQRRRPQNAEIAADAKTPFSPHTPLKIQYA